jgi:DNA end-binding protein Ku
VAKAELEMAKALVQSLAAKWEPEKYKDEYRDKLKRLIQAKAKGRQIKMPSGETKRSADVVDLMERLRRSLAEKSPSRKAARVTRKGRRRRAA